MTLIEKFNELAPDSIFKNQLSLFANLNEIAWLDADRTQPYEDFDENTCKRSSSQCVLHDQLARSGLGKSIEKLQSRLNPNNPHFE